MGVARRTLDKDGADGEEDGAGNCEVSLAHRGSPILLTISLNARVESPRRARV